MRKYVISAQEAAVDDAKLAIERGKAESISLTMDFDYTLNKHHEGFGIDPRLIAIAQEFGSVTIVTHRSFREVVDAASKGFSSIFDQLDAGIISGSELKLLAGIFVPKVLEGFKEKYPHIQFKVCYGNTPREGFGDTYTFALLNFEESLFNRISALYSCIKRQIPDFKNNIIYLINYIREGVLKTILLSRFVRIPL